MQFEYEGKTIDVYPCSIADAPTIVLLSYEPEGGTIIRDLAPLGKRFNLIEISGLRWEDELTPWKHPAVMKGGPSFGGNAFAFFRELEYVVLPRALKEAGVNPKSIAIAGYSLAGMAALYACSRAKAFDAALSISGSLWFDGFAEFVAETGVCDKLRYVYLSLGKKEPISKNSLLATVGTKTERLRDYYVSQEIKTDFVWNEGGHFDNETRRIEDAICAYLDVIAQEEN